MKYNAKKTHGLFVKYQKRAPFSEIQIKKITDQISKKMCFVISTISIETISNFSAALQKISNHQVPEEKRYQFWLKIFDRLLNNPRDLEAAQLHTKLNLYFVDLLNARPDHPLVKEAEIPEEHAQAYMSLAATIFREHIEDLKKEATHLEITSPKSSVVNLHGSFHTPTDPPPEEGHEQQEQNTPVQTSAVV